MTDDVKKEMNDTKISTDTLFVLLLVICGLTAIILVAYLLYKPYQANNDVVIRDIVISAPVEDSAVESVESSLDNSYLAEDNSDEVIPVKEEIIEEPKVVVEDKPIFNSEKTLNKTPTKTTLIKTTTVKKKLVNIKAYWIQVGSFSTKAIADSSVEKLKEHGLSSRVVLKEVNGKSVYRVRIGAYENKEEADKFCNEVKKISGFEQSYVSESTTQKYVEK